jgi:ectoine hydroxylase-related dioxygenase (phytanoyl-CoA dioxygenase family)
MLVTQEHLNQFHEQGFYILDRAICEEDLERLRVECQKYVDLKNSEMDENAKNTIGISHRNNRYFVTNKFEGSEFLKDFLFNRTMEQITRSAIGDDVYLFLELFVVKYPKVGLPFGWHQDSGYMQGHPHKPYLTCWCALDDMSEENGTLYILPYSRAHTRDVVEHVRDEATNDLIGYRGDESGVPINVRAGSIVVFPSTIFHRTGPNKSDKPRRAYLAEYSPEPIRDRSGKLWSLAVPFIKDGRRVIDN